MTRTLRPPITVDVLLVVLMSILGGWINCAMAQQPLMLRSSLFAPVSSTAASVPVIVVDGQSMVATTNATVLSMRVDGGFPDTSHRFKAGPFSGNITSLFPIDGDATRVGVMGENYLVIICTRPEVHVEHVIESSVVGEQFQLLEHRPFTRNGFIFFGTGCDRTNGCMAGSASVLAVEAATGSVRWNMTVRSEKSNSSCCMNYPIVSFPVDSIEHSTVTDGSGTVVAVQDACPDNEPSSTTPMYLFVINASTGVTLSKLPLSGEVGAVQRLAPVATTSSSSDPHNSGIGGVLVQQSAQVSLLASPTSTGFKFATSITTSCNVVGAMPVTVDKFAVLSCNVSLVLLDLSTGLIHSIFETVSVDNPSNFLAVPNYYQTASVGFEVRSCDNRGGSSDLVVFVFSNFGDLYAVNSGGDVVLIVPTPNASTAVAQGLAFVKTAPAGLVLLRSIQGEVAGAVDGFSLSDAFLHNPSAPQGSFSSTPRFTMVSVLFPIGPAVYDNATNRIVVANGEEISVMSGFELTLVANDSWAVTPSEGSSPSLSSLNGIGFDFSEDIIFYSTQDALFAINGKSGNATRLTSLPEPPLNRGIVLVGSFVCTTTEHFLVCGDLRGEEEPWVTPICPPVTSIHNDISAQGDLLLTFCSQQALAIAFSPTKRNWTIFGAGSGSYRPGVASDDTVFTVELTTLKAFSLLTGLQRWSASSVGVVIISNAIAMGDYVYVAVNTQRLNTSLAQFNRASGHLHQLMPGARKINNSENVFVLGADGGIYGDGLLLMIHASSVTIFDTHGSFYTDSYIPGVPPIELSLPAKPQLTPQGIFLFFTSLGVIAFNAFGFTFLWGETFASSVDPAKALSVAPQVYAGLIFYNQGDDMSACDVVTGTKRSILTYLPFSASAAHGIAAAVVSTTSSNLTRVIFAQGEHVVSVVSTLYESSTYVVQDCGTLTTITACSAARSNDLVSCQWCPTTKYCASELDTCSSARQSVIPLVSWANSPAEPTINVMTLPGYAITADSHYIVVHNTTEVMTSILQLPHIIPLPRWNMDSPAGGFTVGATHAVLILLPSTVVVVDVETMQATNISFANVNRSIVAWAGGAVSSRYLGVATCLSNISSASNTSRECSLFVIDCIAVPPRLDVFSGPSFFRQENPQSAFFAMYSDSENIYVMRSVLGTVDTTIYVASSLDNFTVMSSIDTFLKLNNSNALLVVTNVNNSLRAVIQTIDAINVYDNDTAEESTLPMPPTCENITFTPQVGTTFSFLSCSNALVSVRHTGNFSLQTLSLSDKASIIAGVLSHELVGGAYLDPLYLVTDDFKIYFHDCVLSTLAVIFSFGEVRGNEVLGLTWLPSSSTLVTTFEADLIAISINATPGSLVPTAAWAVSTGSFVLGTAVEDPLTHHVFVASDQTYNIMGYDPNAGGSGWLQFVSYVFSVADYGVQFSSSGDLVVLVGEAVRNVEPSTGLSEPAITLPTVVSGESLVAFSDGLVCAADSYVTECNTAVNGGLCARCAPPQTLYSPTIPWNGLAITFCGDGKSSFLAVNPLTMEASFVGNERSTFPGVVADDIVMIVAEHRLSAYNAFPPFTALWSQESFKGFKFCTNAVKVGVQSVTVGQCSIANASIGAAVYNYLLGGSIEWQLVIPHRDGHSDGPIDRACMAALSGHVLGDGLVAVLTDTALMVFGVNGRQFMNVASFSSAFLWQAKNLLALTPEGLLLVGGDTFKVFNVFTGELMLSEFRYNASLVSPEVVGSTILWSTGELLVATDIITGQIYGQIGYPRDNGLIGAVAVDPMNSSRVVIGQTSFLMMADISFVNLNPLPQLVATCSNFFSEASCAAGRGNVTIGCQWCEKLGYCTEMNNFCQEDCSVWTAAAATCKLATNCAFCSDYSVCINAPSCRCSLILTSPQCDETNGMCVYGDGLCRVGSCFSFIVRGFNSLPFVLFLLGLVKDILTLAIVGAVEPFTARFVALFRRRRGTEKQQAGGGGGGKSPNPEVARRIVFLDGKFSVSRTAGSAALTLEEYATFLIDTGFAWKAKEEEDPPTQDNVLTGSINEENSVSGLSRPASAGMMNNGPSSSSDDVRPKLHSALLLFMLRYSVWISPKTFYAINAKSQLGSRHSQSLTFGSFAPLESGGASMYYPICAPPGSVAALEELLESNAHHFESAIYVSSSRFTARIVHCIGANATTLQLVYYVSAAAVLVGITAHEVWNLELSDITQNSKREAMLRFQLVGFRIMNSSTIGTIALMVIKYCRAMVRQYRFIKSGRRMNALRASQLSQISEFESSKLFHGLYWLYFATALPFVLAGSLVGAALYPFIPAVVVVALIAVRALARSQWGKKMSPLNLLHQSWRSARRLPAMAPLHESAFVESEPTMASSSVSHQDKASDEGLNESSNLQDPDTEEIGALEKPDHAEAEDNVTIVDDDAGSDVSATPREAGGEGDIDNNKGNTAAMERDATSLPLLGNSIDSVRALHSNKNLHVLPKAVRRSMRIAYVKREARVGLAALAHFLTFVEVPTILLAAMLQACYNYNVLYDHRDYFGISYWDIPGMDYNSRSFQCFQQTLVNVFDAAKSSLANAAQVLTSVVPFA